jgi:hypothetical protein
MTDIVYSKKYNLRSNRYTYDVQLDINKKGNVCMITKITEYIQPGYSGGTRPEDIVVNITDDIEIPLHYINLIDSTLKNYINLNNHYNNNSLNNSVNTNIINFITDLKNIIKIQNTILKEKEALEQQVLKYEKIKLLTTTNLPYLSKYYESDIDTGIKNGEQAINQTSTEILQNKLDDYRKKYLNLNDELI